MHTKTLAALLACTLATGAQAKVKTKAIQYQQGKTVLQGFVAWDDAARGKRPGVLVVHEWWGHNEHARNQAVRLAKAGYVGLALDMFGKGKVTKHPDTAKGFVAEATKDPEVTKARFEAALATLKKQAQVDGEKIGVVGYCFGGAVALGMARAGEDLDAVVTFHGALRPSDEPLKPGLVKAKVLVQTGGADPFVPKEAVDKFESEWKGAGVDVEVVTYPAAKHGFTNPKAATYGMDALAYDAQVDEESWAKATAFFKDVFGS
jgi:dienelactone hydrolase